MDESPHLIGSRSDSDAWKTGPVHQNVVMVMGEGGVDEDIARNVACV